MKIFVTALCGASLVLSGCSHVARDLRHPGGAVGGILDRRMFDASGSKDLVLLRSTILIAMVARAGTVYARDEEDGEAFINYIVGAATEVNTLAGQYFAFEYTDGIGLGCDVPAAPGIAAAPLDTGARTQKQRRSAGQEAVVARAAEASTLPSPSSTGLPPDRPDMFGCFTYDVNFESDVPSLEDSLFRLSMAALPQEEAKRFLDYLTSGDIIGALRSAFAFSAKALDGLHSGAAVHRSGLEVVGRQYVPEAGRTGRNCGPEDRQFETVLDAARCMGLPTDTLFVGKHDKRGEYMLRVRPQAFAALMRNLRDSCRMIPIPIDTAAEDLDAVRAGRIRKCDRIQFIPHTRWHTRNQIDALAEAWRAEWLAKDQAEFGLTQQELRQRGLID